MATVISGDTGVSQVQPGVVTTSDLASGCSPKCVICSVYRNSDLPSVVATTWLKVNFGVSGSTSLIDDSVWDSANGRFKPTVAGWYQVDSVVSVGAASGLTNIQSAIYKNGTRFYTGSSGAYSGTVAASVCNALVYCNGSTDYLELWGIAAAGTTLVFNGGDPSAGGICRFQMTLVRAD